MEVNERFRADYQTMENEMVSLANEIGTAEDILAQYEEELALYEEYSEKLVEYEEYINFDEDEYDEQMEWWSDFYKGSKKGEIDNEWTDNMDYYNSLGYANKNDYLIGVE